MKKLICAVTVLTVSTAHADILYVDDDAPPGGDGSTWGTAYRFLQDGRAAAAASGGTVNEIRVGQGIYFADRDEADPQGTGNRNTSFRLVNDVTFAGGFAGFNAADPDERDFVAYESILSGDIGVPGDPLDNTHAVLQAGNLTSPATTLDGFTITAGQADGSIDRGAGLRTEGSMTIVNCRFVDNFAVFQGGAVYSKDGLTVLDCEFSDNTAVVNGSGGVHVLGNGPNLFVGCTFSNNVGVRGGAAQAGGSTFIDCLFFGNSSSALHAANQQVINCMFIENTSSSDGGAILSGGQPVLVNSIFINNSCVDEGGAVSLVGDVNTVVNCVFFGNSGARGGGLHSDQGTVSVTNSVFSGNTATQGGAILFRGFSEEASVSNCTVSANTATNDVGGIKAELPVIAIANSICYGNSDSGGSGESAQLTVVGALTLEYSCIQGLSGTLGGIGNIGDDPLFQDPDGSDDTVGTPDDDVRLLPGSPCIDAADNSAVPEDIETDLDGNPRFLDVPETADTGNGTLPIVDMGAYESLGGGCLAVTSQEVVCHADGTTFTVNVEGLNACTGGTTQVTFTASGGSVGEDLCFTALVNDGGFCCTTEICVTIPDCTPAALPSDLDGDGIVGIEDFLALLGAWGSCSDCGTCPADFDGDCTVGILDLLILLGNNNKSHRRKELDQVDGRKTPRGKANRVETIDWVASKICMRDPDPRQAPSTEAWALLKWVRRNAVNEGDFWRSMYRPPLEPSKADMAVQLRFQDKGQNVIDIIDQLQRKGVTAVPTEDTVGLASKHRSLLV